MDNKTNKLRKKERTITISSVRDSKVQPDKLAAVYFVESTELLSAVMTGAIKVRGILSEVCGISKQLEHKKNKRKAYRVIFKKMLEQYKQLFPLDQHTMRAQSHNKYSKAINTHEQVKGRAKRLELQINLVTHTL